MIRVYDVEGKPLKELIKKTFPRDGRHDQLTFYLSNLKQQVFFMVENELKVYLVSAVDLTVQKELNLETPANYKKMPDDYYYPKKSYMGDPGELLKDIDRWKSTYSAITQMSIEDNFLVVQIRTFGEKSKKFVVLFYDLESFILKDSFPTNDYFIGTRAGKYYFYANGNPRYEEDADQCIINIYTLKENK